MPDSADEARVIAADIETLRQMGYRQELLRRMSGFSNYAVSLSIICILAGGITSFHQGLCSVGGASIVRTISATSETPSGRRTATPLLEAAACSPKR